MLPAKEYLATGQSVQALLEYDPAGEVLPAAQFVHVDAPVEDEYFPAAQSAHALPLEEYLPTGQFVQAMLASDPAGDDLPAGHEAQKLLRDKNRFS